MTTEIYLTDINYSDLKQSIEYANCRKIDTETFNDMYHELSYYVPNDILGDKWKLIQYITDMVINDYQTIKF
jgi:hypothetical protein